MGNAPHLAPYACHPSHSRGRLHAEEEDPMRDPHQRDRDRIIHCAAFRRLEYKTQVFVNHEGDHYRTRLTHSLEVSQLARSLCRSLGLNEDLGEALALAHDLGHPPFGHAGEDALKEVMAAYGGFDHNAQAIRVITLLEHRYAAFDGLNLTWETLEGIAKHNGPLLRSSEFGERSSGSCSPELQTLNSELSPLLAAYNATHDLELHSYASAEAQAAALADDIAYNNHDMEDGIRAGLFMLDELAELPMLGEIVAEVDRLYPALPERRRVHEVIRRVINRMVTDVLAETGRRLKEASITSVDDIRALGNPIVALSEAVAAQNKALKSFLMKRMYRHYRVNRMTSKARRVLSELFAFFHSEPDCLPTHWRALTDGAGSPGTARVVCDFIAGMTDRFALDEYRRVFEVERGM